MRKLDIIIKAILDGRSGSKLRFRPKPQNGSCHDVRARMPDALQFGHFATVVQSLSFTFHIKENLTTDKHRWTQMFMDSAAG